jgi:transcriptional regulator GlxA family with amidase domain
MFTLAAASTVFSGHIGLGLQPLVLCAEKPGQVETDISASIQAASPISALLQADLIILPPTKHSASKASSATLRALREAHARGAIIAAIASGVFLLAKTGLLRQRSATTHCGMLRELAQRFPDVNVVPNTPFVDDGQVITGSGQAADIELFLYLLGREHGGAVADSIAECISFRRQYKGYHARRKDNVASKEWQSSIYTAIQWARANIDQPLEVGDLATRAMMSQRSFARHFKTIVGSSPYAWLLSERLRQARQLLAATNMPVGQISQLVGFRGINSFRGQFTKRYGMSPNMYRAAAQRSLGGSS